MKNEKLKIKKDITQRTYNFALRIVKFVRSLPKETAGLELGKQLLRSGTSIAANVEEAQGAFSKDDFTYKMQTSFKEARETNLWLKLIRDSHLTALSKEIEDLNQESRELRNILAQIVKTAKSR